VQVRERKNKLNSVLGRLRGVRLGMVDFFDARLKAGAGGEVAGARGCGRSALRGICGGQSLGGEVACGLCCHVLSTKSDVFTTRSLDSLLACFF
jgi:hypothetical protein